MIPKLIYNVGILFVMMLPGIILKKTGMSTDGLGKGLSNIVLYIAQPALILRAYIAPFNSEILVNILIVMLMSVVTHLIFSAVAMLCFKRAEDSVRRMLRFATIFSNAAFMGIPLIESVLGAEATIYATVYNITFNLFLWTLGVHICTADRDYDGDGVHDKDIERKHKSEASVLKALIHPVTIASAIGLFVFFLPIDGYVPDFAINCLDMLKGLVAPLSMVVIGLRLADINFKGIFNDGYMYLFLLLRHAALPLIVFVVMKLLSLVGLPLSYDIMFVILIMSAAPAASSATMFAEKYDCNAPYVSKNVAISTILSIVTMPLISLLLNI